MKVSMEDIKALREQTGAGIKDCKNALIENANNMSDALDWLRKKGIAKAAKKASRIATEGMVHSVINADKNYGVIVEINCETDFVGRTDDFQTFSVQAAEHLLENPASSNEELLAQNWKFDSSLTVENVCQSMVQKTGENVRIRRFDGMSADYVATYIHAGARLGILLGINTDVAISAELEDFAEDICMHIAEARPQFTSVDQVSDEVVEKEREIQIARAIESGKPKEIAEKMVIGRINKWKQEICLLDQEFDDSKQSVAANLKSKGAELGGSITIKGFVALELGEGLEKKQDNFAEEVAAMSQN